MGFEFLVTKKGECNRISISIINYIDVEFGAPYGLPHQMMVLGVRTLFLVKRTKSFRLFNASADFSVAAGWAWLCCDIEFFYFYII